MALIGLVTYCTEENKKLPMLQATLISLKRTVDLSKHRIMIFDNSEDSETARQILLMVHGYGFSYLSEGSNLGTARGINRVWKYRTQGEHCVKMDDDVVVHCDGWADQLEHAIELKPDLGILGLKRKDCWERPDETEQHKKSELTMINPKGEKWVIVEMVEHVIGTCQMYNSNLLDKIGFMYQIGLYGYDDVLAAHRSKISGFKNAFLPHIEIDHIDDGSTPYQGWKERTSGAIGKEIREQIYKYYDTKNVYHEFY